MASAKPPRKRDFKTAVEDAKALATVLVMEAKSVFGRRTARVLGVVALFVVGGALFMHWYISPDDAKERQGLALVLAISLGGIAAMVGLYLTGQQLRITRELEETRAREVALRACLEQLRELVTDDKWDKEVPAGRTLRQLAQAEVLSVLGTLDGPRKRILVRFLYESKLIHKGSPTLDLSGADLRNADLNNHTLPSTALPDVRLGGANLSHANLSEADLRRADLSHADLSGDLYADLGDADPSETPRSVADLSEADLSYANLSDANLHGANLHGANLHGANLHGANLHGANLISAYLFEANLSAANLRNASGYTNEELEQQGTSLVGAIMPNGQKYEDWLKDLE